MEYNESVSGARAALVSVITRDVNENEAMASLEELRRLLETAGGEAAFVLIQNKETPDVRTYLGSGKVAELAYYCAQNEVTLAVFDCELSPSQIRNLEEDIGGDVEVIDRSMLILDIFALHATTGEGKLQVELAQLKYTAPRLIGKGAELSRLGGTIGTRGPGESKLEQDRRHIKRRIDALEAQIAEMESNRATMRAARDRSGIPKVAIVGYTNAGKSTLLNYLTDAGVLSEDKLFATLDPTTRRLEIGEGESVLLTDTVGFIRRLPHHLIKAFRSTLEEAALADILLVLVDATDDEGEEHLCVTENLLNDLGAGGKPTLYVYNKCDRLSDFPSNADAPENTVFISAYDGRGIDLLLSRLLSIVQAGKRRVEFLIPYSEQGKLSSLYSIATVESVDYAEDGVRVCAVLDQKGLGLYRAYLLDPPKREEDEWDG